jgi:hypothetical protein
MSPNSKILEGSRQLGTQNHACTRMPALLLAFTKRHASIPVKSRYFHVTEAVLLSGILVEPCLQIRIQILMHGYNLIVL